jgi:hypothetical protein
LSLPDLKMALRRREVPEAILASGEQERGGGVLAAKPLEELEDRYTLGVAPLVVEA